jgi:hypothetical protein
VTMTALDRTALLDQWIEPSSNTEKEQQDRAQRMVQDAVKAWPAFDGYRGSIRVYTKGSYPNETNVRRDSDVDVVVQFDGCIYYDHGQAVTLPVPGSVTPYEGIWTPAEWRSAVSAAMVNCFGANAVDGSGKVAINIAEVPNSRPSADFVPSFSFHRYWDAFYFTNRLTRGDMRLARAGSAIEALPYADLVDRFPQPRA